MRQQIQDTIRASRLPERWNANRQARDRARGRVRGLIRGVVATTTGFDFRIGRDAYLGVAPGAELHVGNRVTLYDQVRLNVESAGAVLSIGDRSFLNFGSQIFCRDRVQIGSDCAIGFGCMILDNNLHELNGDRAPQPVVIGDRVWLGSNVTVLPGVQVGSGAVVGAGSVVTRNVPAGVLVVGNPAQPVRDVTWAP